MGMRPKHIGLVAIAYLIAGCATTGDPRQGGLFGWSESKADDRQEALQREANESVRSAEQEKAKTRDIQARESALKSGVEQLRSQLDKLIAENQRLESELKDLARTKSLRSDELERVRAHLAQNERIRQLARVAATQSRDKAISSAQSRDKAISSTDMVDEQNQRLQKEILFLLRR